MQEITLQISDATYEMLVSNCPTGKDGLHEMLIAIISNGEKDFIEKIFKDAYKLGISIDASIPTSKEFNRIYPLVKEAINNQKQS